MDGVTQSSTLRPLLFNIFLAGLCFIKSNKNIASYADYNTSCIAANNIDNVIKSLEEVTTALFQRFDNSFLKSNLDKFHLLIKK